MTTPTIEPGYEIITPENQAKFEPKRAGDEFWNDVTNEWSEHVTLGEPFFDLVIYRRRTAPVEGKGERLTEAQHNAYPKGRW